MLEVTVRRRTFKGQGPDEVKSFQLENDALQGYLDALTVDDEARVISLRSMASQQVAIGAEPVEMEFQPAAKRDTLGIRTPIQETARAKATAAAEGSPIPPPAGPILPPKSEKK